MHLKGIDMKRKWPFQMLMWRKNPVTVTIKSVSWQQHVPVKYSTSGKMDGQITDQASGVL